MTSQIDRCERASYQKEPIDLESRRMARKIADRKPLTYAHLRINVNVIPHHVHKTIACAQINSNVLVTCRCPMSYLNSPRLGVNICQEAIGGEVVSWFKTNDCVTAVDKPAIPLHRLKGGA